MQKSLNKPLLLSALIFVIICSKASTCKGYIFLAPPIVEKLLITPLEKRNSIEQLVEFINHNAWENSSIFGIVSVLGLWHERRPSYLESVIDPMAGTPDGRKVSILLDRYRERVNNSFWNSAQQIITQLPDDISSLCEEIRMTINEVINTHEKYRYKKTDYVLFSFDAQDQLNISLLNIKLLEMLDNLKEDHNINQDQIALGLCDQLEALVNDFFNSQVVGIFFYEDGYYWFDTSPSGMGFAHVPFSLQNRDASLVDKLETNEQRFTSYSSRLGIYRGVRESLIEKISGRLTLTPKNYIPTPEMVFEEAFNFLDIEQILANAGKFYKPIFIDFGIGPGDAWQYLKARLNQSEKLPIGVMGFDIEGSMVAAARRTLKEIVDRSTVEEINIADPDQEMDSSLLIKGRLPTRIRSMSLVEQMHGIMIDTLLTPEDINKFLEWIYPAYLPPGFKLFISVVTGEKTNEDARDKLKTDIITVLERATCSLSLDFVKGRSFPERNQHRWFFGVTFLDSSERYYSETLYKYNTRISDKTRSALSRPHYIETIGDLCVMTKEELKKALIREDGARFLISDNLTPEEADNAINEIEKMLKDISPVLHLAQNDEITFSEVKKVLSKMIPSPEHRLKGRYDAIFIRIAIFLRYYNISPSILNESFEDWFLGWHHFGQSESLVYPEPEMQQISRMKNALIKADLMKVPTSKNQGNFKKPTTLKSL